MYWTEQYFNYIDKNYKKQFDKIYESKIVDRIFGSADSIISKRDFLNDVSGAMGDKFIFSPYELREIFQTHVDLE